jgi:Ni/Fe-hydrogenase subunit HybB-like protein
MWKRPYDMDVLVHLNKICAWLVATWLLFRSIDLLISGKLGLAFRFDVFAGLFWVEMIFLLVALYMLVDSAKLRDARLMFHAHVLVGVGGLLYRFNPTTLAFQPNPGAFYFPSAMELLISIGFVSLAIAGFCVAVKVFAILPAPTYTWFHMEAHESKVKSVNRDGNELRELAAATSND